MTVPLDVFRAFNALAELRSVDHFVTIEVVVVAAQSGRYKTAQGFEITAQTACVDDLDALIVPGLVHVGGKDLEDIVAALGAETKLIGTYIDVQKPVLAACSGVFLLAASGVLDGRTISTSWWLAAAFCRAFPDIALDTHQIVTADRLCVTAGGTVSYYDLALWLVEHFVGKEMARACAKLLVVETNHQSQAPFVARSLIEQPADKLIRRARSWLNERLVAPVSIQDLAQHCNVSPRTLLRRFHTQVGESPARYLQTLRFERARLLLESSSLSIQAVLEQCGYADVATFRKTFKRLVGITPNAYRQRFGR